MTPLCDTTDIAVDICPCDDCSTFPADMKSTCPACAGPVHIGMPVVQEFGELRPTRVGCLR